MVKLRSVGTGVITPTDGRHTGDQERRSSDRDLCDARPGSLPARVGARLSGLHPFAAGLCVVALGYVLVAGLVVAIGFLLTDVLLPGDLQRWDLDVVRDLASGRPDLNDASLVATFSATGVAPIGVTGSDGGGPAHPLG